MRISDTREICDFISIHAAEFDHVNVTTSSQKLLQFSRLGVLEGTVQHVFHTLEVCVLQKMQDFGPQEISNTLHIIAKKHKKTSILQQLERRAETISREFDSQSLPNTLWVYVTMGTKPGEQIMGQLERRAEVISGNFISQNVANTLWAYVTMGINPGDRLMGQLERRTEEVSGEFNS